MSRKRSAWGHLASQKYSALLFCVAVLALGGFYLSVAAFMYLVPGVVGLYGAFVGGRAWSDGQALKFGQQPPEVSAVRPLPAKPAQQKKEDQDVD
jgi:hypothetical protein